MIEIRRFFGTASIFRGEDLEAAGITVRLGAELGEDLMPKYEYWSIEPD